MLPRGLVLLVRIDVHLTLGPAPLSPAMTWCLQGWCAKILALLPEDKQAEFKTKSAPALKYLLGMVKDLQLCAPSRFYEP